MAAAAHGNLPLLGGLKLKDDGLARFKTDRGLGPNATRRPACSGDCTVLFVRQQWTMAARNVSMSWNDRVEA